jgi:hypothetical protein
MSGCAECVADVTRGTRRVLNEQAFRRGVHRRVESPIRRLSPCLRQLCSVNFGRIIQDSGQLMPYSSMLYVDVVVRPLGHFH